MTHTLRKEEKHMVQKVSQPIVMYHHKGITITYISAKIIAMVIFY